MKTKMIKAFGWLKSHALSDDFASLLARLRLPCC